MDRTPHYTPALLKRFDRLTEKLSSRDQLRRIEARLEIKAFVETHGKEGCDAMFEALRARNVKNA